MADNNKVGRPPRFSSAEEIQSIIDKYFKECEGRPLLDKNKEPVLNKWEQPIIIGACPPTVTGLALALGFNSRQTLLNYQDKEEFMDTITRAKARVEAYAESRLFDKDGANGAKFSLSNNFKGWAEKQEIDNTIRNPHGEVFSVVNMSTEELEKQAKELAKKIASES